MLKINAREIILHGACVLCLGVPFAACTAATDGGFATPKACTGSALAAALPSQPSLNGYRYVGTQCLASTTTARYRAGASVVEISLIDTSGQQASAGGQAKSATAFNDMFAETYESMKAMAQATVDLEKTTIESFKRRPSSVVSPEYYPVISKLGADEVATHIPLKEEATGDFTTAGVLKQRYLLGVEVKRALTGKDGPAAKQTIEPFLQAIKLSKL